MVDSSADNPDGGSPVGMMAWWSVTFALSTEWRLSGFESVLPILRSRAGTSSKISSLMYRLPVRG